MKACQLCHPGNVEWHMESVHKDGTRATWDACTRCAINLGEIWSRQGAAIVTEKVNE